MSTLPKLEIISPAKMEMLRGKKQESKKRKKSTLETQTSHFNFIEL